MQKNKIFVVTILLLAAIAASFGVPRPKYQGLNVLAKLNVPLVIGDWQGKDVADLNMEDGRYNFISKIFARTYANKEGVNLDLFILDAGNFHNPKICFTGAGFKISEVPDKNFMVSGKPFRCHSLIVEKDNERYLLTYWITIDKKNVDWFEQKANQLFSSLVNRKKAGLMCRIDLPFHKGEEAAALALTERFINDLAAQTGSEGRDYIFGRLNI
jgi:EpsI family protein